MPDLVKVTRALISVSDKRGVEALAKGMKKGDPAAGFEVAIGLCGDVLAAHFPPRASNPNEVADRLVLI